MQKYQFNLFSISLITLVITFAQASDISSFNWNKISKDKYLANRMKCQIIIEDFNWKNTIWPSENTKPKPKRFEIFSDKDIETQVISELKMESALSSLIGIHISGQMLQGDLNRMSRSTQLPEKLKLLFKTLNNNPRTIAECISRPNLIKSKFINNYYYNNLFHQSIKDISQNELNLYLSTKTLDSSIAIESISKFSKHNSLSIHESDEINILSEKNFLILMQRIKSFEFKNKLIETKDSFIYEELIDESNNWIKVKSISWPKLSFDQWWSVEKNNWDLNISNINFTKLRLPNIHTKSSTFNSNNKNFTADSWYVPNIPTARNGHTAIWTGSEIIIWGGNIKINSVTNTGGRYNPVTDNWIATTLINAPTETSDHTAVWTGTEMIIWGGYNTVGGRYNPNTDSWSDITLSNAPASRGNHATIWTGTEMIVWGGGSNNDNEGGRYNPSNDTWTRTNTIGAPINRENPSSIWTGSEMIVWGGRFTPNYPSGGRYNPISDSWQPISIDNAPTARLGHTAIWTGEKMIIWAGDDENNSWAVTAGSSYDPITDLWTEISNIDAPIGTTGAQVVWTGEKMIVWGGWNGGDKNSGGVYNPQEDSWVITSSTNAPEARTGHTAVWTGDSMIIWGGDSWGRRLDTGAIYNSNSDTWIQTKSSNEPNGRFSGIWTGTEMIIWGGTSSGKFNPVTNNWQEITLINNPSPNFGYKAIWTGSQMIIWGGGNLGISYNPLSDTWTTINTENEPYSNRYYFSSVWTGTEMLIWGGYYNNHLRNNGGLYNPETDTWRDTTLVNAPLGNKWHTTVWTGSKMIVWGGYDGNSLINSGYRYNPSNDTWNEISSINAPSARRYHSAIWTGFEMIVFGGDGDGSVWSEALSGAKYNPVSDSWNNVSTPSYGRKQHLAIWTGTEMILWGGGVACCAIPPYPGEKYNPETNTWSTMSLNNAPPGDGRGTSSTAIWSGDEMLLWQGVVDSSNLFIYYPYTLDRIFNNGFE